jgi:hypothetical protein
MIFFEKKNEHILLVLVNALFMMIPYDINPSSHVIYRSILPSQSSISKRLISDVILAKFETFCLHREVNDPWQL